LWGSWFEEFLESGRLDLRQEMFKDELAGFTFLWGAGRAANGGAKAASRPVVAMLQRRAAASLPRASEMSSSTETTKTRWRFSSNPNLETGTLVNRGSQSMDSERD